MYYFSIDTCWKCFYWFEKEYKQKNALGSCKTYCYKIEAAIRVGLTVPTPTELPCESNEIFVRNITGLPVADINLYTEKAKEKVSWQKLTS